MEKANPAEWKVNKNKALRNSGFQYKSKKGELKPAKIPQPVNCENCKFKCNIHFDINDRNNSCRSYHKLDYERQKDFIRRLVEYDVIHRKRPRTNDRTGKGSSRKYYFLKGQERIRVCKTFFLKTLCMSWTRRNCFTKSGRLCFL